VLFLPSTLATCASGGTIEFGIGEYVFTAISMGIGALLAVIAAPIAVEKVAHVKICGAPREGAEPTSVDELLARWQNLQAWFENDEPLLDANQDLFERRGDAAAMAHRLASADDPFDPAAIMLLGARGVGKTSFRAMITPLLDKHEARGARYEVVPLSAWEYPDSDALHRATLGALLHGLSRVAPVLDLQGIPLTYVRAIGKVGQTGAVLSQLTAPVTEPKQLVELISQRAVAAKTNIVLWIDDLERFGIASDADAGVSAIASLLHLIRQNRGITYVLAFSSEHPGVAD
jgi:hypothetical protein